MKQLFFTIEYLPSIGSYLDEQNIDWTNDGNDTITICVKSIKQAFEIGIGYEKFMQSLETE